MILLPIGNLPELRSFKNDYSTNRAGYRLWAGSYASGNRFLALDRFILSQMHLMISKGWGESPPPLYQVFNLSKDL